MTTLASVSASTANRFRNRCCSRVRSSVNRTRRSADSSFGNPRGLMTAAAKRADARWNYAL